MKNRWKSTQTVLPPENVLVHTKIDDKHGCRNEQKLMRVGNIWVIESGRMYVYYCPTHWREI